MLAIRGHRDCLMQDCCRLARRLVIKRTDTFIRSTLNSSYFSFLTFTKVIYYTFSSAITANIHTIAKQHYYHTLTAFIFAIAT